MKENDSLKGNGFSLKFKSGSSKTVNICAILLKYNQPEVVANRTAKVRCSVK